jgi:uncharacterized Zn-finger protein
VEAIFQQILSNRLNCPFRMNLNYVRSCTSCVLCSLHYHSFNITLQYSSYTHPGPTTLKVRPHPTYARGVKTFPCPYCPRILSQNGAWHRHMRNVHLKLRPYKCSLCHMTFPQRVNMERHQMQVHKYKQDF